MLRLVTLTAVIFSFLIPLTYAVPQDVSAATDGHEASEGKTHPVPPKKESTGNTKVQSLLRDARQQIFRAQYDMALKLLETYLQHSSHGKVRPLLQFYVIDAIGRIHLRIKQDPDGAIKFFSQFAKDGRLSDAEHDIIQGWISAAKEWKALGKMPVDIHDASKLYEIGKKYYESGLKKQKFVMDSAGSADFSISATYLVPFTVHFDKDARIEEVLYMMGDIRRRTWYDNEFWSENFYLIEVIRRFPNTPIAIKAYTALDEDVHFGYTGSSGDNTPRSWLELLKEFKDMAEKGKEPAVEPIPSRIN
jgi:hypothetical protein